MMPFVSSRSGEAQSETTLPPIAQEKIAVSAAEQRDGRLSTEAAG
jgi:hypothetical protein